jgi:hypothetical protein
MKSTKKSRLILALGMIVCAVCCYQMLTITATPDVAEVPPKERQPRESITFILGEDSDANNRYYEEASHYYAQALEDKTAHVVTSCRSLLEVRDYLEKNGPRNRFPRGLINPRFPWQSMDRSECPRSTRLKAYNGCAACGIQKLRLPDRADRRSLGQ